MVIFQIIIKCGAHAQNSKSPCFIFLLFLNQCCSNKLWKHKKIYKESFLIVVSSWNCNLILMLERPLSHYWTSPLTNLQVSKICVFGITSHTHYHRRRHHHHLTFWQLHVSLIWDLVYYLLSYRLLTQRNSARPTATLPATTSNRTILMKPQTMHTNAATMLR